MIEIYRYEHYINKVENEAELHDWILRNVPPLSYNDQIIAPTTRNYKLYQIAKAKNYTFRNTKLNS